MNFAFEHTYTLSEAEYVAIFSLVDRRRRARLVRWIATIAAGIVFLFSSYTFVLGVALLGLVLVNTMMPHMIPGVTARWYRQSRYIHGPVTYGADEDKVWARTPDFLAKVSWRHVTVWREQQGWLLLQGNGFPMILLPIEGLKREAVYEAVMRRVREHAVEFGSVAARARLGGFR